MNRFASFTTKIALAGSLLGASLAASAQVSLYLVPITPTTGTVAPGSIVKFAVVTDIVQSNFYSLTIGAAVTYDTAYFDPKGLIRDPLTGKYPAADGAYNDPFWLSGSYFVENGMTVTGPNGVGLPTIQTAAGHARNGTIKAAPGTHTVCTYSFPTLASASGNAFIYLPTAFHYNDGSFVSVYASDTLQGAVVGLPALPKDFTYQTSPGSAKPAVLIYRVGNSTNPFTTILTGPLEGSSNSSVGATFTFIGTDNTGSAANLRYQYSLDGAAYTTPSPNTSAALSGLAEGLHTFRVAAVDSAGNADANPPIRHFTVDVTPPTTTILTGPTDGATITDQFVNFTASGTDNLTSTANLRFQFAFDGVSYDPVLTAVAGGGQYYFNQLALGPHTFSVAAIDQAGNIDPNPIVRHFTVSLGSPIDTIPPTTTITDGPSDGAAISDNGTSFAFTGLDNLTIDANLRYQYALDGGSYTAPSPVPYVIITGLAQGPHTFQVAAVDQAGNVDPNPPTRHFTVDLTPPTVSILTGPAEGATIANSATFTFVGSDNLTPVANLHYEFSLDFNGFLNYTSNTSVTYTQLTNGLHTFRVVAVDQAGNTTYAPATRNFTVDTIPPTTTILTGPAEGATILVSSVAFTFTGADNLATVANLRYQYSIDGGAFSSPAAATTANLIGLAKGPHTFQVAAIDQAGNVDPNPPIRHFTVDTQTYPASGRIALEGVSDLSGISAAAPLGTFHIGFRTPATKTEVYGADVPLTTTAGSAFGAWTIPNALPGTFDVWIKGAKNLAVLAPNVTIRSATTLPDVTLPAADADNSNAVNVLDFGPLVSAYGAKAGGGGSGATYDPTADFNFDGVVDVLDFGLLVMEYGEKGAP